MSSSTGEEASSMEVGRKNYPSLPQDYVSLQKLQERRFKEKERNQGCDKGEERQVHGKQEDKVNYRSQKGILEVKEAAKARSYVTRPRYCRNRWNQSERGLQWVEARGSKLDESQFGDVGGEADQLDKKKNKKRQEDKRRPKAEGTALLAPEKEARESTRVDVEALNKGNAHEECGDGCDSKVEGGISEQKVVDVNPSGDSATLKPGKYTTDIPQIRAETKSEYRRNSRNGIVKDKVRGHRAFKDQRVQIGPKFQNLALDGEMGKNISFRADTSGGHWRHDGASRRIDGPRMRKQRDDSFIWVKKTDKSDTNVSFKENTSA